MLAGDLFQTHSDTARKCRGRKGLQMVGPKGSRNEWAEQRPETMVLSNRNFLYVPNELRELPSTSEASNEMHHVHFDSRVGDSWTHFARQLRTYRFLCIALLARCLDSGAFSRQMKMTALSGRQAPREPSAPLLPALLGKKF